MLVPVLRSNSLSMLVLAYPSKWKPTPAVQQRRHRKTEGQAWRARTCRRKRLMFTLSHLNTLFLSGNPVVVVFSYFSEINAKLVEKDKFVTHCVKSILKRAKIRKNRTFLTRKVYQWLRKVPSVRRSSETNWTSPVYAIYFSSWAKSWNSNAEIFRLKQTRPSPVHGKLIWRERLLNDQQNGL